MQNYRNLKIWNKSLDFSIDIYKVTENFPREEMYGLTNQLRRAAISISANISEGCGRETNKDLLRFLNISMGSANECETFIEIASRLDYLNQESKIEISDKIIEIKKMISVLVRTIKTQSID